MIYYKKQKTFLTAKKAAGFPIFYRTPPALMWQGFGPPHSAICRTEHLARTAKNPKNRRGFPFYSSGASNPKGSGAQYCSPPNTVIGIETLRQTSGLLSQLLIAALLIPSSVLKQPANPSRSSSARSHCSPPNTVIGIETKPYPTLMAKRPRIAALLIPSSVLKHRSDAALESPYRDCSPPNTVIGIETPRAAMRSHISSYCSPPNTVIGIETLWSCFHCRDSWQIAALLIPSSVLKPRRVNA